MPDATRLAVVLYPGLRRRPARRAALPRPLPVRLHRADRPPLPARARRAAAPCSRPARPAAARLERLDEAVGGEPSACETSRTPTAPSAGSAAVQGDLAMTAYAPARARGRARGRRRGSRPTDRPALPTRSRRSCGRAAGTRRRSATWRSRAWDGSRQDAWATTFRRRRDDLSVSGLAWMAMRGARARRRGYDADELAGLLLERAIEEDGTASLEGRGRTTASSGSDREATGLAVQALLVAGRVRASTRSAGLEWLLANRVEGRLRLDQGHGGVRRRRVRAGSAGNGAGRVRRHAAGAARRRTSCARSRSAPQGLAAADRRFLRRGGADLAAGPAPPRLPPEWTGAAALGRPPRDRRRRATSFRRRRARARADARLPEAGGGADRGTAGAPRSPATGSCARPRAHGSRRGSSSVGEHRRPRARPR